MEESGDGVTVEGVVVGGDTRPGDEQGYAGIVEAASEQVDLLRVVGEYVEGSGAEETVHGTQEEEEEYHLLLPR